MGIKQEKKYIILRSSDLKPVLWQSYKVGDILFKEPWFMKDYILPENYIKVTSALILDMRENEEDYVYQPRSSTPVVIYDIIIYSFSHSKVMTSSSKWTPRIFKLQEK